MLPIYKVICLTPISFNNLIISKSIILIGEQVLKLKNILILLSKPYSQKSFI